MKNAKDIMLEQDLENRDITDERVLNAMREVDRTLFVPESMKDQAYADHPLPIGDGQTISQPYIVAYMAQALGLQPGDTVLEAGTGCGYNAAVLSKLADRVYSVEIIESLAKIARANLDRAGISNVEVRHGDGYAGWPDKAPFDGVILTAAPAKIPEALQHQLRVGGRLIAPVGVEIQYLVLLEKTDETSFREHRLLPVRFVPMTGGTGKDSGSET